MDLLTIMDKEEIRELFSKNWMTHDAMWYGCSMQALGPDKANQLNQEAVRLMAGIEIGRIVKLMGKPNGYTIKRFDELTELIETTFGLIQARFMKFEFWFPEKNLMSGRFNNCFAYEGVKTYAMIEHYDCGIFERIKGWLDALGVTYETTDFTGCLMHQTGKCEVDFHFQLA